VSDQQNNGPRPPDAPPLAQESGAAVADLMKLWQRPAKTSARRAVAYYRHSAEDRQENSVEIQRDAVRKFAAENGITIIREFADRGRTGLCVEGRDSFNEMLQDYVIGRKAEFEYVLVLDMSRWGRYQNQDYSAYYSVICMQNGKEVVYTSIGIRKENDPFYYVLLSLERHRAASYSLELSGKVWKGSAKIASFGYWAGGSAPYGMCRMLLDERHDPVRPLAPGERKAIQNQRVTLAPSKGKDAGIVRHIFHAFVEEGKAPETIARALNGLGEPSPGGGRWGCDSITSILRNEVYAGVMVWNKSTQKMKTRSRPNPASDWVRAKDAFASIVPPELFQKAQEILTAQAVARARKYSDADMVRRLREIHESYGTISSRLVAAAEEMVSANTYAHRFGSFDRAYQAIFHEMADARRAQIIESIRGSAGDVQDFDDFVVIDNYFSIAIQPAVPIAHGYEASWTFHPDQRLQVDLTIGVPLSCPVRCDVLGFLAFPRLMFKQKVRIHSTAGDTAELYAYPLLTLINELRR